MTETCGQGTIMLSYNMRSYCSNVHYFIEHQKHDKIKEFARRMLPNKHTLFMGIYQDKLRTMRRGKFALDKLAWNHDYLPGYCRY